MQPSSNRNKDCKAPHKKLVVDLLCVVPGVTYQVLLDCSRVHCQQNQMLEPTIS